MDIKEQLIKHEGLMLKPYTDSVGKLTIGVGRNLDDIGITKNEAIILLENDIKLVVSQCENFQWFNALSNIRKKVIIDMVFNLGITRFKGFKNTINHIDNGDYDLAATEMLDSKWSTQVGSRSITLSNMMRDDIEGN